MKSLTRLKEGRAIGAFDGFVESWNFVCDWIENIKGEGEDDESKSLKVDRTVADHPVIRGGGGGGDDGTDSATETAEFVCGEDSNITFTKYYQDGKMKIEINVYYV